MATETLQINSIDATWSGASGAATDIDEVIGSPDTTYYGAGPNADAADFGFVNPSVVTDSDTVTNISFNMIYRDDGTAGTLTVDVELLIGGVSQGTQNVAVTGSDATYSSINNAGWNSDWTLAQLQGAQLRLTPQQSGMPGTNAGYLETANMVVTYTPAPSGITVNVSATAPQPTATATATDDPVLDFDGVDDGVSVGDVHDFSGTAPFTAEGWTNINSTQVNTFARLISKEDLDATTGWSVIVNSGILYLFRQATGSDSVGKSVSTDTPIHFAAVYDGAEMEIYIDGSPTGSPVASSRSLPDRTEPLMFGRPSEFGVAEFTGTLREIRVWDHARTSTEINAFLDKRLTGQEAGLVGYWRMDEGSGATVTDDAGSSNGTITGATWRARPSPVSDYTAAASATAPQPTASAVATVTTSAITANVSATASQPTASAVAVNPVSAVTSASSSQPTAAAVAANPVSAIASASAPQPTASAVATISSLTVNVSGTAPQPTAVAVAANPVSAVVSSDSPLHTAVSVVLASAAITVDVSATSPLHTAAGTITPASTWGLSWGTSWGISWDFFTPLSSARPEITADSPLQSASAVAVNPIYATVAASSPLHSATGSPSVLIKAVTSAICVNPTANVTTSALQITDTNILNLPVDYQMAGTPPDIREIISLFEKGGRTKHKTKAYHGGSMVKPKPSFTVTTSKKGYE